MANPETMDAPELKPERISPHLNELKENLLYEPSDVCEPRQIA